MPIRIIEVELTEPLPTVVATHDPDGRPYLKGLVLARLHTAPIGLVEVDMPEGKLSSRDLAHALWKQVAVCSLDHLHQDGLERVDALPTQGLTTEGLPRCLQERADFLAQAPLITVLIPSRERPQRLRRCIDSILASVYPSERLQILVVDNAPATSDTKRLVDGYSEIGNSVRYAREDSSGSASARNHGLRLVDTELVAMTDDDAIVDPHWLTEVARAFAAFPEASCVTGLLVPAELDFAPQVWFEQYGGFTRGFSRRIFDLKQNRPIDPLYPWTAGVFGTGNNFSFRTDALREIGGFDPALGNGTPTLGGVDSEALLRTILSGQTIVYEPRALVHHAHRPTYEGLRRQVYAYGVGLTAYYLKTLLSRPTEIPDFARRIPAGVRFLLSSESALNESKQADYPKALEWLERRGMLAGPWAYARSRRRYGRHQIPLKRQMSTPPTRGMAHSHTS